MVAEQTVDKQTVQATPNLTPAQEALQAVWEEHTWHEFGTHSTENVLATMLEDAYVNNIPVMMGGGRKSSIG
jgi:carboxymethylenebutenolidase